jgi:hypothetical protein
VNSALKSVLLSSRYGRGKFSSLCFLLQRFSELYLKNRYRHTADSAVPELARSRIKDRRRRGILRYGF